MNQEQVFIYKHLDEPLEEGRFVLECILATVVDLFGVLQDILDCTVHLFGLTFFLEFSVSCYQRNCSLPETCTERLHSWYCAKLKVNKYQLELT